MANRQIGTGGPQARSPGRAGQLEAPLTTAWPRPMRKAASPRGGGMSKDATMAYRFLRKDYDALLAKMEELADGMKKAGEEKGMWADAEWGNVARQLRL